MLRIVTAIEDIVSQENSAYLDILDISMSNFINLTPKREYIYLFKIVGLQK